MGSFCESTFYRQPDRSAWHREQQRKSAAAKARKWDAMKSAFASKRAAPAKEEG